MHRKTLVALLAVLGLALSASPALAASPHRYTPRHGHKCHKTYRRVKHGRKVYCVKRKSKPKTTAPTPTPAAPKVKLHAHLDPTFTRNPLNPFEVTYAFSASATKEVLPQTSALVPNAESPAALPSGVLALYSDGKLECAINVGSGVTGSQCPVGYVALGDHSVTTIYSSGEESATETEVEHIAPLPTSTSLTSSFNQLPAHEVSTDKWQIGSFDIAGHGSIPGVVSFACGADPGCIEVGNSDEEGSASVPVFVEVSGYDNEDNPILELREPRTSGALVPLTNYATGATHVRATLSPPSGYAASSETAPLVINPTELPGIYPLAVGPTAESANFAELTVAGVYSKAQSTALEVRYAVEGHPRNEGCVYQIRVDGQPLVGDEGFQAAHGGIGVSGTMSFPGLSAGPHSVEVWARYSGSEPGPTCSLDGRLYVSE